MGDLSRVLLGDGGEAPRLVYGTVASASPLTVIVPPSTVAVAVTALDGATFAVGAKVAILQQGADRLVIAATSPAWNTLTGIVRFGGATTNVTSTMVWRYDGPMVDAIVGWALSGAPAAGFLTIALPVPVVSVPNSSNSLFSLGDANMVSQGVQHRPAGRCCTDGANLGTGNPYDILTLQAWTDTVPFTWKNTDAGNAELRYRWI